jgi:hypothetical protein
MKGKMMTKKRTKQYFDHELQKLADEGLIKVISEEEFFGPGSGLRSFTRPGAPAPAMNQRGKGRRRQGPHPHCEQSAQSHLSVSRNPATS